MSKMIEIDGNNVKVFFNGHEVEGNPFDVIMEASFDYLRNSLFQMDRYRNPDIPIGDNDGNYLIKRIEKQYDILNSMTDEEVALCREKSIIYKKLGNIMLINSFIFNLQTAFRTKYCECNPEYDSEIEKLFFGEESSEYLRRKALIDVVKKIYKSTYEFDEIDELILGAMDYLDPNVKRDESLASSVERYDKGKEFVELYSLQSKDVDFMASVVKHMKDDVNHTTENLFKQLMDK